MFKRPVRLERWDLQPDFVLHKLGLRGHFVVQNLGSVVVASGDPIQAATLHGYRQVLGGLYQCPPQALAALVFIHAQIL